jgi:aryl-phospho-beta-D-glucosidase BglC (GH1 family)
MTHYGFNFQWMLVGPGQLPGAADERALDFMVEHGFNFVRLPMNYRVWTAGFDYTHPNESVFRSLDRQIAASAARGIHVALNLHHAPGYCITPDPTEIHNLWRDRAAQDGFVWLWQTFAERYRGFSPGQLSFDLINEPPAIGENGFTRAIHERLIRETVAAIRSVDESRPIAIDGLDGGNLAMPELADLDVIHSTRGYAPYPVSHWGAEWWAGWKEGDAPRYPGVNYKGKHWGRDDIREFYRPWREVERMGRPIHVGEFGCYNKTPNADALRWFEDVFGLWREFGWGYAMWNFAGPFGIVDHGRPGARFETRG